MTISFDSLYEKNCKARILITFRVTEWIVRYLSIHIYIYIYIYIERERERK